MNEPMLKLMIVDDSEEITDTLQSCLCHKFKIITFNNPTEALIYYRNDGDFYALLVDIQMPVMTGVELSNRIFEINPNQPILIMTGFTDSENIRQALKIESLVRIIKKPYDLNELLLTLDSIDSR